MKKPKCIQCGSKNVSWINSKIFTDSWHCSNCGNMFIPFNWRGKPIIPKGEIYKEGG